MENITIKIQDVLEEKGDHTSPQDYSKLLQLLDYTTLNSGDRQQDVKRLCSNAKMLYDELGYSAASICVYPSFVNLVSNELKNYPINVTSVAGGFPSSQTSINIKTDEIKFAIENGADEIDVVLPRGLLLDGNINQVKDELKLMREASSEKVLKIILESGMLETEELVITSSQLAIESGADFIKTSTGKEAVGATLESHYLMIQEILSHQKNTGKVVGIKPAGGISTPEEAFKYITIAESFMNETFVHKDSFRVGASRLLNAVVNRIAETQNKLGLYNLLEK